MDFGNIVKFNKTSISIDFIIFPSIIFYLIILQTFASLNFKIKTIIQIKFLINSLKKAIF